ncbi:hypothetical protein D9615_004776 [Tricholomella constricta]|uniref:F-box domain-containing protein n=1 Tax=Tricholomella constricta TaxID=117010 RepID=A0A8H5HH97_9AGAR|nr:hypothetical protein D9615_004776 [Tricholomella constricta]
MIFQFLDDASNASNAHMCKQWSDFALDMLWREVKDLYHLLSILAPLEGATNCLHVLTCRMGFSKLESSDWRNFERYCWRVRRLAYYTPGTSHALQQSMYDDIAHFQTSLDRLSSLHTLEWNTSLSSCVMFMHKNVKTFAVTLSPGALGIEPLFDDKLTLPQFCLTTKLAEFVSHVDNLESIAFQYFEEQGRGNPSDVVPFKPILAQESFPSLWDLSITVSFDDAARFLDQSFAPTNITTLYLDSSRLETPADFLHLITTITSNCQLLKTLALVSYIDASSTPAPATTDDTSQRITLDTLRPLLKCPNLTSLEIVHHHPLGLQHADIEELARAWPAAESLLLNTEPADLIHSPLTLRALLPFAQHCPNLRALGLFLDATATADLELELGPEVQTPQFKALRRLAMGVSLLDDASTGAAALFLSRLCPERSNLKLDSGITWDEMQEPGLAQGLVETVQGRCERWERVVEMMPLLVRLRGEERRRARALQMEVEDLRWRNEVLVEMAKAKAGRGGGGSGSGGAGDGCVAA